MNAIYVAAVCIAVASVGVAHSMFAPVSHTTFNKVAARCCFGCPGER